MSDLPPVPTATTPALPGASIALAVTLGATLAGAAGPLQTAGLLLGATGLGVVVAGVVLRRRERRVVGSVTTLLGFAIATASVVAGSATAPTVPRSITVLALSIGPILVALALLFLTGRRARPVALAGIATVFAGMLANAVVADVALWRGAIAVSLACLATDVASRSIGLGETVGAGATTSVEFVGAATTAAVAVVAAVTTLVLARVALPGTSLVGLSSILLAVLVATALLVHVSPVQRGS